MVKRLDDELIHLRAARQLRMAKMEADARYEERRAMSALTFVLLIIGLVGAGLLAWWLQPTPEKLPTETVRTMAQR